MNTERTFVSSTEKFGLTCYEKEELLIGCLEQQLPELLPVETESEDCSLYKMAGITLNMGEIVENQFVVTIELNDEADKDVVEKINTIMDYVDTYIDTEAEFYASQGVSRPDHLEP